MNIAKIVCLIVISAFVICLLLFFSGYYTDWSSHRRHATEIELAFNGRLLPAAAFVRSFTEREHRLPTDEEMEKSGWQIGSTGHGTDKGISLYRERPNFWGTWGVRGKDFLLYTEVPDWNLYYSSWDNKRIEFTWP